VHAAGGDTAKQQAAGAELAKAIGLFVKLLLEGLVIWVTAKGIGAALKALKGTALDNPTVTSWLKERAGLTEVPVTGMATRWITVIARPMATGAAPAGRRSAGRTPAAQARAPASPPPGSGAR